MVTSSHSIPMIRFKFKEDQHHHHHHHQQQQQQEEKHREESYKSVIISLNNKPEVN